MSGVNKNLRDELTTNLIATFKDAFVVPGTRKIERYIDHEEKLDLRDMDEPEAEDIERGYGLFQYKEIVWSDPFPFPGCTPMPTLIKVGDGRLTLSYLDGDTATWRVDQPGYMTDILVVDRAGKILATAPQGDRVGAVAGGTVTLTSINVWQD